MIVAVVICGVLAMPAWATASSAPGALVRTASRVSGLPARHSVRTSIVAASRYAALLARARNRDYPDSFRRTDETVEALLGLTTRSVTVPPTRAWYDTVMRRLFLQRRPRPPRGAVLNEVVRALVDQNYNLRRLSGLRVRDHDRWLAARGIVDGTAALASGLRASPLRGTPLDRFTELEASVGTGPGRTLAAQLRSIGGKAAVASALRTFPQTTEQLLHIDKFLEREPALPVRLPQHAGPATLESAETFGELDVRNLLQAFAVPSAVTAADGWGGGRVALYAAGNNRVAAIVLRWDSADDALEWQTAASQYVAAAFPGATPGTCPPLDRCWTAPAQIAAGVLGATSVLASGPGSAAVAAALLTLK
jgi:hypothetical protein